VPTGLSADCRVRLTQDERRRDDGEQHEQAEQARGHAAECAALPPGFNRAPPDQVTKR
jgi:hypothetical protein